MLSRPSKLGFLVDLVEGDLVLLPPMIVTVAQTPLPVSVLLEPAKFNDLSSPQLRVAVVPKDP